MADERTLRRCRAHREYVWAMRDGRYNFAADIAREEGLPIGLARTAAAKAARAHALSGHLYLALKTLEDFGLVSIIANVSGADRFLRLYATPDLPHDFSCRILPALVGKQ
jgi:hypothetical protein